MSAGDGKTAETGHRKFNNPIIPFMDRLNKEDIIFSDYRVKFWNTKTPIVIDNGSYHCRAGWASEDKPRMVFRSVVAKTRPRKEGEPALLVGNDMKEIDLAKLQPRSAFDQNIVYNFELQEYVFDHVFQHLGINDNKVDHPIFMTEPMCNPNYCRKNITEMLMEAYNVPSVCYGIDGLFSYYYNRKNILDWPHSDALIVSSGHSATHIYSVASNTFDTSKCKRLSVGGNTGTEFMRKLLHLKYPWHKNFITTTRAQYLKEDYCRVANNYTEELKVFTQENPQGDYVNTIQLPYTPQVVAPKVDVERKAQTKKEQGNRLKELNERRRREKVQEQEEKLAAFFEIKALLATSIDDFHERLAGYGMMSEAELSLAIADLEESLGRAPTQPILTEDQLYPLIDIPDAELTEEQLKQKKRQKFLKSTREGRLTAKRKRDQLQQDQEVIKQQEEERYQKDPQLFIAQLHERRKMYLDRKEARNKKRQQMAGGGRRQAASQQRLKMLTQIESEEKKSKRKTEDNFGADDKDWDVYLGENDADADEDEAQLANIETLLTKYDSNFNCIEDNILPILSEQAANQIHLTLEKIRVPEMIYQPQAIAGVEQMGLSEAINSILSMYDKKTQERMVKNVFYTGGNTLFIDFQTRLEKELTQMRPFQSMSRVVRASDPSMDTWKGMALWYRENVEDFNHAVLTRAEYPRARVWEDGACGGWCGREWCMRGGVGSGRIVRTLLTACVDMKSVEVIISNNISPPMHPYRRDLIRHHHQKQRG